MEKIYLKIIGILIFVLFFTAIISAVSIFYFMFIVLLIWLILKKQEDRKFLSNLFIVGMLIKCTIAILLYWSLVIRGQIGAVYYPEFFHYFNVLQIKAGTLFNDEFAYTIAGWEIKRFHLGEIVELPYYYFMNGYLYWIAFLYAIFGYSPLLLKLFNCLFSMLSAVFVYLIAGEIFDRKVAKIASLLTAFSPSLMLLSVTNLKDPLNTMCLAIIVWGILKIFKGGYLKWSGVVLIFFVIAVSIRRDMIYPLMALMVIASGFYVTKKLMPGWFRKTLIFGSLIIIICYTIIAKRMVIEQKYNNLTYQMIDKQKGNFLSGGHVYKIYKEEYYKDTTKKISLVDLSLSLSIGGYNFFLTPFPWEITSWIEFFYYPQVLVWYILIPFTVLGILTGVRYSTEAGILFLFTVLVALPILLTEANIGTAIRHRDLIFPCIYIFSIAGLMRYFRKPLIHRMARGMGTA